MNIYYFIANRFSNRNFRRSGVGKVGDVIAIVSISISIAVIIIAIAVAGGFREQIRGKVSAFTGDITLSPPGQDILNYLYPVEKLSYSNDPQRPECIENMAPVVYRTGLIRTDDQIEGVILKGVDSTYSLSFFEESLVEGALPDYKFKDTLSQSVLISSSLANKLGYKIGDMLTCYFVGEELAFRIFTISGIYAANIDEVDKKLIIADSRVVQQVNGWSEEQCSGYELLLKKNYKNKLERCKTEVEEFVDRNTSLDADFSLLPTTVEERFYILFDWLRLLDINVLIVLILMIAVAGFNMISSLLIFIFEKISHIGLLKALGMSDRGVAKVFLYRSAALILKGVLIGNAVALVFSLLQWKYHFLKLDSANYSIDFVPISIDPLIMLILNLASFVIIMLLLFLPCHFISKINPARSMTIK